MAYPQISDQRHSVFAIVLPLPEVWAVENLLKSLLVKKLLSKNIKLGAEEPSFW